MKPPYICFWYFENLGGLFWVWILVFENFEIVLWIIIPTFGGLFYKTFWFEASLYMFLIFRNFKGSFVSLFFIFRKFGFLKSKFPLLGVCFIKLFYLRPPYICFWFFGNLGGAYLFQLISELFMSKFYWISKAYKRRPQIKKFYKTYPQKLGILIQNTISKF